MYWLMAGMWLMSGCGYERLQKRLEDSEFDHWYALRVFMSDTEKKTYLKLKTQAERDEWLKSTRKLWDTFYKYEPHIRELIVAGDVQKGWTEEMLYMSWGSPWDRQKVVGRNAVRSEKLIYRFEAHSDGSVLLWEPNSKTAYKANRLFVRIVILDDSKVASINEKNASW